MLKKITIIGTILVVLFAVSYNWLYEFVVIFGFKRAPIKPYENGKCRKLGGVEACEDIHIHHRTGYAFMPCGTEYEKSILDEFDFSSYQQVKDVPYIYDINNDKFIPLVLKNFPPEEDFITHGLGIYEDPENENKLYMFFINHKKSGSVVEIFEHTLHTNELIHLETVEHELIYTPNDIVPVSRHEFYLTNFNFNKEHKFFKILEVLARLPLTNVVFHSSITNETKIAVDGLRTPNGIISNWDHSLIYVSTVGGGDVLVYERNKDNNELKLKDRIFTGYPMDNISVDDVTGELYCAVVPSVPKSGASIRGTNPPPAPVGVLKISNNTEGGDVKYSQKIIFEDDGTLFLSLSVAAPYRKGNVLLFGSFIDKGIIRCDSLEPLI